MPRFKTNHTRHSKNPFGKRIFFLVLIATAILVLFIFLMKNMPKLSGTHSPSAEGDIYYLPKGSQGEIYSKNGYTLSYLNDREQAEWVAYRLTRSQLNGDRHKRPREYRSDPVIRGKSATDADYRRSGYTRGHLVPAADRAHDRDQLEETFYFSNMSPQLAAFNGGVWRELEECTRDWARKFYGVYVVAGPLFDDSPQEIGHNGVDIPKAFYKVILDLDQPEYKAIAFVIPHERQEAPLQEFALSVDEVEEMTGLDFFGDLLEPSMEKKLESRIDVTLWPIAEKRYQQRIKHWNKR